MDVIQNRKCSNLNMHNPYYYNFMTKYKINFSNTISFTSREVYESLPVRFTKVFMRGLWKSSWEVYESLRVGLWKYSWELSYEIHESGFLLRKRTSVAHYVGRLAGAYFPSLCELMWNSWEIHERSCSHCATQSASSWEIHERFMRVIIIFL